jgi:hypothetical protein
MDPALSSITVSHGRLFTQARRETSNARREFAVALESATGREIWARELDAALYPDGGVGPDDGPRSTPVVDGDRVYVFTSYLRLFCLDAATGEQVWMRDFMAEPEMNADVIRWQNAASPVIVGDLILVNANASPQRILAIRKADGSTAWRAHDDPMTQATPIVATLGGVEQAIFFTQNGLVSVRPESGAQLWRFTFPYSTSTAASPVVIGDQVFCGAYYGSGSGVVRVTAADGVVTANEVWKRRGWSQIHWATPITDADSIYAIVGDLFVSLRCLDVATGDTRWEALNERGSPNHIGTGSVLKAGGYLLILTASGRVILAELNPAAYTEIDSFPGFEQPAKCWNSPAIDSGILYLRSTLEMAAFDIGSATVPPLPLRVSVLHGREPGDHLELRVLSADGSPLDPDRIGQVRLFRSSDLALPLSEWTDTGLTANVNEGAGVFEVTIDPGQPQTFLLVREGP